jgi:Protein of unknown function (DUF1553)/Protein of unknown function (DUF1549)
MSRSLLSIVFLVGFMGGMPSILAGAEPTHWAFVPPRWPTIPAVRHAAHVRTAIDHFVEGELEKHGLSLGPKADRATLLRRVSFDLTGLPPSLSEMAAFLEDTSADAYESMVKRYLSSPHYGERWGKHWLDAAGYADSNGYFSADSDRPLAYRYRDYVIRAFNEDKPYDRFVQEQLAGDELAGYGPDSDVTGQTVELLTATHFLRNAPDGTGESDGNADEVRTDKYSVLEGNLQIAMNCLLGITIQCARCHAHKFEPIRHEDYYRLEAIFVSAYAPERWVKPDDRVVLVGTRAQREDYQRQAERVERQVQAFQAGLRTQAESLIEQVLEERLQSVEAGLRSALLEAFRTPQEKRSAEQRQLLEQHARTIKVSDDDLVKRFPEYGAVDAQVKKAIAERRKDLPPLEKLAALVETDPKPPVHHLLRRGLHNAPGPEVQPGVPAAFDLGKTFRIESKPREVGTGRRTAFARWVTSPDNPLFARVMVNRIWQQHFGVGLVATPDNFGQSGARPSHPELLDYLALQFIRSGWSIKAMHRLILKSAVYRQAGTLREDAFAKDPDNRLLWRYPLRRLDAEAVRDDMLAVAGELDCRLGGPYVPTRRTEDGSVVVDQTRADARRRSVYLQQRRTQVATFLELFDAPAMATTCSLRNTATVPLQSLALMNSAFVRAQARAFARRLMQSGGQVSNLPPHADDQRRVERAFRLACGRPPRPEEASASGRFLTVQRQLYSREKEAELQTWTNFCQMILASNAFLYVE